MSITLSLSVGGEHNDDAIDAMVESDETYNPEVVKDWAGILERMVTRQWVACRLVRGETVCDVALPGEDG